MRSTLPTRFPRSVAARTSRALAVAAATVATLLVSACGGGGGGGGGPLPDSPVGSVSGEFSQRCAATNPYLQDSDLGPNARVDSLEIEKRWLREYLNEAYLWSDAVPSVEPTLARYSDTTKVYASLDAYFKALTATPADRQFSAMTPTKAWNAYAKQGLAFGYGVTFVRGADAPPRNVRLRFVEPGTAAATAGLRRGDTVVSIDGTPIDDASTGGTAFINEALNPSSTTSRRFVFSRGGSQLPSVVLTPGTVTLAPVPVTRVHAVAGQKVGYLLFKDQVDTAEPGLINAITQMRNEGVNDLVVDLRHNVGATATYLSSQLAFMIAGDARTLNRRFEQRTYSDKRVADTARPTSIVPFYGTSCYFNSEGRCTNVAPLPSLNLGRVWVLTSRDTCAASESFINALRGVDVEVRTIGATSCGKPYGGAAKDNCGISYLPMEYRVVNHKGEGNYTQGFTPTCAATDNLNVELGDASENLLAAALFNRSNNACSPAFAVHQDSPLMANR